jgi:hypothetical protein
VYAASPDKQKRIAKKPDFKAKKEQANCLLFWCESAQLAEAVA